MIDLAFNLTFVLLFGVVPMIVLWWPVIEEVTKPKGAKNAA